MRTRFDKQLDELHVELIKMGSMCEEAITLSVEVLKHASEKTINQIHTVDSAIDQKERDIENICIKLLLQQQPVASDLRMISAALKMISDMERIGDQAGDIAEMAAYLSDTESSSMVHLDSMGKATIKMVTNSVEAFVQSDRQLAEKVIDADDEVDRLFDTVKNELMDLIYNKGIDARAALDLLMTAKYFERIGDHAVNIAEWVVYSITGVHKSHE
ncbi:MAG TPA: phosphate signaling complex protein PhoU [Candidatus Limivivens merdigallinarum]|uniref:Phosphate-specific transport system accessory protein PhoU n=1 Tax=Candidatus Limivivens merdigallinarum TaxID=2840859 RepID=A0A9D1CZF7_9FIRM|nr:phosphate signaling complex protein PhoU [Candidatus Limivivens merdigallinarum]